MDDIHAPAVGEARGALRSHDGCVGTGVRAIIVVVVADGDGAASLGLQPVVARVHRVGGGLQARCVAKDPRVGHGLVKGQHQQVPCFIGDADGDLFYRAGIDVLIAIFHSHIDVVHTDVVHTYIRSSTVSEGGGAGGGLGGHGGRVISGVRCIVVVGVGDSDLVSILGFQEAVAGDARRVWAREQTLVAEDAGVGPGLEQGQLFLVPPVARDVDSDHVWLHAVLVLIGVLHLHKDRIHVNEIFFFIKSHSAPRLYVHGGRSGTGVPRVVIVSVAGGDRIAMLHLQNAVGKGDCSGAGR